MKKKKVFDYCQKCCNRIDNLYYHVVCFWFCWRHCRDGILFGSIFGQSDVNQYRSGKNGPEFYCFTGVQLRYDGV